MCVCVCVCVLQMDISLIYINSRSAMKLTRTPLNCSLNWRLYYMFKIDLLKRCRNHVATVEVVSDGVGVFHIESR